VNRTALAVFLRSHRERLRTADVGLPAGVRRRTPGLRREEVALLAGMSVDYYVRLEQARGPQPSRQLLGALRRALRLTDDEFAYLLQVADDGTPAAAPCRVVPSGILRLLDRLDDMPALVLDAVWDVLAWNPLAVALIGDFSSQPADRRNGIVALSTQPADQRHLAPEDWREMLRNAVADLRAASARYPRDPRVRDLIAGLQAESPEFAELWAANEVAVHRSATKRMNHPLVGPLVLDYEMLCIAGTDQRLMLYSAQPGTETYEKLQHLRALSQAHPSKAEDPGVPRSLS
jgi:transcriptional regulator with XRE-family HTH domain